MIEKQILLKTYKYKYPTSQIAQINLGSYKLRLLFWSVLPETLINSRKFAYYIGTEISARPLNTWIF